MTAETLRTSLLGRSCVVRVDAGGLSVDPDAPPDLEPYLGVLHTGLRAIATGRRWYGSTTGDGKRAWVGELDPAKLLPSRVSLLCVEGDAEWDRLPIDVHAELPELFEPEKEPRKGKAA